MDAVTILKAFQDFYGSSRLSGVTIVLPGKNEDTGQTIFAHKIILAAGSPHFEQHFADNPDEESDSTDDEAKGSGYEVEMKDVYDLDSPDYYVPVLRYLYGQPLCAEGEHMGALALKEMCDAAQGFDIPRLRQLAMRMLEELLSSHLRVESVKPLGGEPLPVGYQDTNIGPFLFELDALFASDDDDGWGDDTYSDAMEVAVKVCCEHLEILRQFLEFHDRCPAKLYRHMLFYEHAQRRKV